MFEPTKDVSTKSLANAFIKRVLSIFSIPKEIYSDKGSAMNSKLWKYLCSILNIKHASAASLNPRACGHTERAVRSLTEGLAVLAKNDDEIEDVLPLVEFNVNCTVNSSTGLSPFQLIRGSLPNLGLNPQPIDPPSMSVDARVYYEKLQNTISDLHKGAKQNVVETREMQKEQYTRTHRTCDPNWTIGTRVMLQDLKIKPHSRNVITHKRFRGPYVITHIAEKEPDPSNPLDKGIGRSYRLVDEVSGIRLKNMVPSHRLKKCPENTARFYERHPRLPEVIDNEHSQAGASRSEDVPQNSCQNRPISNTPPSQQVTDPGVPASDINTMEQDLEPALRIIAQRKERNGPYRYLVLFADKSRHWADTVSDQLLAHFRITQEKRRQQKRKTYRRH